MIINILFILLAVLLFSLVIFIHELGHFFTAKLLGIRVNKPAIGMGLALFHFQKGETQYSLRLLSIGGYCAMEGESEGSENDRALGDKPVWRRIVVVYAGTIMNILFSTVLMMVLLVQQPMFTSVTIAQLMKGPALQRAGAQTGDQFYSIDSYCMRIDRNLGSSLATANPQSIDISVMRKSERLTFHDVKINTRQNGDKQVMVLDFYVSGVERNPVTLIQESGADTASVVYMAWYSLVGLVTGQLDLSDVAGPTGTADTIPQAVSMGLKEGILPVADSIIMMAMIITVNFGVVSLLPLPIPDGGRLIFLLTELIRRHPINLKYGGWIHAAGFALLMTFMIIVTYSDVPRPFTEKGPGA